RHYEWAGFDVLAITDHWVRTVEPSTERLLVIPSTELNATAGGPEHDAHVLALGLGVDPELPDVEVGFGTLGEVVAWVNEQGAVLAALREGRFYSSTGPVVHELEISDETVEVRCSPVASATLVAGRRRGARANAGRLGYPHRSRILETNDDGLITSVRLERPP